jgi:very-short-patch-repair endonuclease
MLWQCLRDRRLDGMKFRRQHALANTTYVADFFCYSANLVIELDGRIHDSQAESDAKRQQAIESLGYRVLRFKNDQIESDLESVLKHILMLASGEG